MLARRHRFSGPHPVRQLQKTGTTVRGDQISLKFQIPSKPDAVSRAAVVVSKKVDKRAVVRNNIRRRMYEVLRTEWEDIAHPVDMAFGVFSADVADMPHDELVKTVRELLKSAKLLK